ncbi:hypothetical protein FOXG_16768 [Fusarium oxysporum f. sp. lycopersici 4287]|uniref:DUF1996 domain-containing protein n=5 Tax=Fusarium oxysporum TaxID=5507 RepID=A0A0J9W9F1_FUSO4|nr:hypothetical protein FOXG_16768 [Fusarium oxysporum f. sp. lycopersici 4287]KAJ9413189.1 hypothetical protein QL093DRAFT_2123305 [Fusarium oxysporum]KNB19503.1 hypothetical protein FOXG_16768 [Fusarium oxysporum f. sp. lycopersici 4287]
MRSALPLLVGASLVSAWTELHHEPFMNKNIDPIVVPGTYASHMHTFFGSDAVTNVLPTSSDLQKGCYSGQNANDLSVYWIPTLYYVDGDTFTEVPVFRFSTYYTNAFAEMAIPQDFAMISGNASAQTQAEADHPSNGLEWFCEGSDERESDIAKFPTSTCDQHLQVSLRFPNCVNPDNLAEYDWSDDSNKCPEGMKTIPQLRYAARYDTNAVVPGGWSGDAPFQLSCGSTTGNGYCFHGDFINGWYEDAAENMLASGGGGYEDGQFISGEHGSAAADPGCTATDQDPDNGTSDYLTSVEMMSGGSVVAGAVNTTSAATERTVQSPTLAPATTPTATSTISRRIRIKTRAV